MECYLGIDEKEPWVDHIVKLMKQNLPRQGAFTPAAVGRGVVLDIFATYHQLLRDKVIAPVVFTGQSAITPSVGVPDSPTAVAMMKIREMGKVDLGYVITCLGVAYWSYTHDRIVPMSAIDPYRNTILKETRDEIRKTDAGKQGVLDQFKASTGISPAGVSNNIAKYVVIAAIGIGAVYALAGAIPGTVERVLTRRR